MEHVEYRFEGHSLRCGLRITSSDTGAAQVTIALQPEDNEVPRLFATLATRIYQDYLDHVPPEAVTWIEHHTAGDGWPERSYQIQLTWAGATLFTPAGFRNPEVRTELRTRDAA